MKLNTFYNKTLQKLVEFCAKKGIGAARVEDYSSTIEIKNQGRGKDKREIIQFTVRLSVDSLVNGNYKEKGDLRNFTNLDFESKLDHLKVIPLLLFVPNKEEK